MFVLVFVVIAPQSRIFLAGLAAGAGSWIAAWAPISYILLLILLAASVAGIYLLRTWPVRVDEGNPMAKYRKDLPLDED
jgi:hypothetical protein